MNRACTEPHPRPTSVLPPPPFNAQSSTNELSKPNSETKARFPISSSREGGDFDQIYSSLLYANCSQLLNCTAGLNIKAVNIRDRDISVFLGMDQGLSTYQKKVQENQRTKSDPSEQPKSERLQTHSFPQSNELTSNLSEAQTLFSTLTDCQWGTGYRANNPILLLADQCSKSCLSDGKEAGLWLRSTFLRNRWRKFQELPQEAFGKPVAGDACIFIAHSADDDGLDPDPSGHQALAVRSAIVSGVAEAAAQAVSGFVTPRVLGLQELSEVSWNLAQAFLACPNVAGIIAAYGQENYWGVSAYNFDEFLTAPKKSLLSDSTFPLPPTLLPVFDHIWVWIEYCCLPQAPFTSFQEEEKHRQIAKYFSELQRNAITLVLDDKYAQETSRTHALTLSSFLLSGGRNIFLQPFRSDCVPAVESTRSSHNLEMIAQETFRACRSSHSLAPILDVWKRNLVGGSEKMHQVLASLLQAFFLNKPLSAKFGYEGAFVASASLESDSAMLSGYLEHAYTPDSLAKRVNYNIAPDPGHILHVIKLEGENVMEDSTISAMITEHATAGFDVIVSSVIPFSSGLHIRGVAFSKRVQHIFTESAQQFPHSQITNSAMSFAMGASTSTKWIREITRRSPKEAAIESFVRSYKLSVLLNLDSPISQARGWFPAEKLLPQLAEEILEKHDERSSQTNISQDLGNPEAEDSSKSFFLTLREIAKERPFLPEPLAWGTSIMSLDFDFLTAFSERRSISCRSDGNEQGVWLKASQLGNQLLRHQDIPKSAFGKPSAGDACLFVSHRWESKEHPDPEGQQATAIRAAVLASLVTAANFLTGKHFGGFAGFIDCQILAHSILRCPGPTGHLAAWARDNLVTHDFDIDNLSELLRPDAIPLAFFAAMDRIWLWIDFCCLPQTPRTHEEQSYFKESLAHLSDYQKNAATLVLHGETDDLHTRGWCIFEYIASRGKVIGVEENSSVQLLPTHSNMFLMGVQLRKVEMAASDAILSIQSPTSSLERAWTDRGIKCSNGNDLAVVVSSAVEFLLTEPFYGTAGYRGVFVFTSHEGVQLGAVGEPTSNRETILHIIRMIGEDVFQDLEVSNKLKAHRGRVVVSEILPGNISGFFVQGVLSAPEVTHIFTHRASLFPDSCGVYSQGFCLAMGASQEKIWLENILHQFGLKSTEDKVHTFISLYQSSAIQMFQSAENLSADLNSKAVVNCHKLTRKCFEHLLEKEGKSAEVYEMREMYDGNIGVPKEQLEGGGAAKPITKSI